MRRGVSPQPRFTPNSNNQFTDTRFSYDSDGNNTADSVYSYTYDPENQVVNASGMSGGPYCYIYDAKGLRVAKAQPQTGYTCFDTGSNAPTVDVLYWRNTDGDTIAETDSTGSTSNSNYHEYIFFAGRRVARSDVSSSNVDYHFADHLGSTRAMTDASGNVCFSADYFPYGQELDYTTTCNTSYKFTGYERDAETGNDYAFARYYNPRLSRFMSEDPGPRDITDPQTLNRYAYVRNNSANMTDPSGLCSDFEDDSSCNDDISFSWGVDVSAWESRNGPQPAIYSPPAAGHDPNPFDGETNGIPNGMQIPTLGLPGLILPGDPGCPYGAVWLSEGHLVRSDCLRGSRSQ